MNLFLLPVLIAGLGIMVTGPVTAQTFTTLHSFPAVLNYTNSGGANPYGGLVLSGNTLYGTTRTGGNSSADSGTVFAINTDGTGFTNFHNLNQSDGCFPYAGLILSGNTLYGTTTALGSPGAEGTVFAVSTDGSGFSNVHSFSAADLSTGHNSDGANPYGGLILSGNTLYGTANKGGDWSVGTVFAVNTDGSGFTNLHNFNGGDSKGVSPYAALVLSGNTLYGTTFGPFSGTVFAMNTDGTGFTNLHGFNGLDGANPYAGLLLSSNTLYGTTFGPFLGTVFALKTDGTGFTNLHSFTQTQTSQATNSDGARPYAGLILSGNTLYGTTTTGGSSGNGTVFAVNTDGMGFANLHNFTATTSGTNSDGTTPHGGLVLSGHALYGTTTTGGSKGGGTIFRLSLPQPQLAIIPSRENIVVKWPTDATSFALQSTTNLGSSAFWTSNSPVPVIVNGQNTVTNPITGTQQFFRLSQ
jgi:uncharacterized repeat protein (TIGR03803 family)